MSKLAQARTERSQLLQRLESLRTEIKHEEIVDLDEKWDKLQNLQPYEIKIGGLNHYFSNDIFDKEEHVAYQKYLEECDKLKECINNLKNHYYSTIHESIVDKVINEANNRQYDDLIKRQLINNLSHHKKAVM